MSSVTERLSERLKCVADMLKENGDEKIHACDVGCDHGYVSIYLVQEGIAESAIAMDVRKGPLSGADENIKKYGLEDRITTRLSDGLRELSAGEADSLVIAGMGGKLMIRLLTQGEPVQKGIRRAVLQPQSELYEFRKYLRDSGYAIADEKIVYEDGKYYFPMKVIFDGAKVDNYYNKAIDELVRVCSCSAEEASEICNRFGEVNILKKTPLLLDYCTHGKEVSESIMKALDKDIHPKRYEEIKSELRELEITVKYLEQVTVTL